MSRGLDYPTSSNPFFDDDDDDDEFTHGRLSSGTKSYGNSNSARSFTKTPVSYGKQMDRYHGDISDSDFSKPIHQAHKPSRAESIQAQIDNSQNRQLDSTQRAMASIYESERMGVATAEELLHQREQLDNIERNTDKINADTKVTQTHLNGLKSVFGGLKNWWNKDKKESTEPAEQQPRASQTRLASTMEHSKQNTPHPALGIRDDDYSGFYDDAPSSQQRSGYSAASRTTTQSSTSGMSAYEQRLDQNLDLMSGGMARLKDLAQGLGDEIVDQNEQLERIQGKTERADATIRDQNKQMFKILGK